MGRRVLRVCLFLAAIHSSVVLARPTALVVAMGDCRDADLVTDARALTRALRARFELSVLTEDDFRKIIGAPPDRGIAELQLQLDAARSAFYAAQYNRAKRLCDDVASGARRLDPSPDAFELYAQSQATLFLTLKGKGQLKEALGAFRNILRVNPSYKLSDDLYANSTRRLFEQVRAEIARETKFRLEVASQPTGATVFIDGFAAGRTPSRLPLVPGLYRVVLGKDGTFSLPHDVHVDGDMLTNVDLAFETALPPQRFACLNPRAERPERLAEVLKLGSLVGVDKVVALSLERPAGVSQLRAVVLEVPTAQRTRDGAIKVVEGRENPEGLEDLATFVATGGIGHSLVASKSSPTLEPQVATLEPALDVAAKPDVPRARTLKRPVLYALGGVGAAAAVVGGVLQGLSSINAAAINLDHANGEILPDRAATYASLIDASRGQATGALVAFGVAAAALGTATGLYLYGIPLEDDGDTRVNVGPGGVQLSLTWE